jgi:hypothetical protein
MTTCACLELVDEQSTSAAAYKVSEVQALKAAGDDSMRNSRFLTDNEHAAF